jgi:multiple sugar transport system permease protein
MANLADALGRVNRPRRGRLARKEAMEGYLAISPWLIGLVAFTAGPILASFGLSFTDWNITQPPAWVGLRNYSDLVNDEYFWDSLRVTLVYSALSLPLNLVVGLFLSVLLNQKLRGMYLFRTLFYLPSVVAGVATAALWLWIFNPIYGILNILLSKIGITGPAWLADPHWALYALVIMSVWGAGGNAVIYLAGLQNIPAQLYEAAAIDGAGRWAQFWRITIPLLSPTILFLLVMGIIGSFQTFTTVYVLTNGTGGPEESTLFYMLYLYQKAFQNFQMGYASALAWVGAIIAMALALLVFKSSPLWVYYEAERK